MRAPDSEHRQQAPSQRNKSSTAGARAGAPVPWTVTRHGRSAHALKKQQRQSHLALTESKVHYMLTSTLHSRAAQAVSSVNRKPHLPGRGIVDLDVLAAERQ